MTPTTHPDARTLGQVAAEEGAAALGAAVQARGEAVCVLATGASQFATLAHLVTCPVPWGQITVFHLDEYLGLSDAHPASFVRYLRDRFLTKLPTPPRQFHAIQGHAADPAAEVARLNALFQPADVMFLGIGENGHLAFNDPPADFAAPKPFAIAELDAACRAQQAGEGWFAQVAEVPTHAITMTVPFILQAKHIIASVPDARKASAVRTAVRGPVRAAVPASALQLHPRCSLHLDPPAAAEL